MDGRNALPPGADRADPAVMDAAVNRRSSRLRDLYSGTGPVASVYFDLRPGDDEVFSRWRAVADALSCQGADRGLIGVLWAGVLGALPGRGVLAMFAADGRVLFSVVMPEASAPDRARYGLPHLLPLLAWLQDRPAHVVVLLDRTGAGIVVHPGEDSRDHNAEQVAEVLVPVLRGHPVHLLVTAGDVLAVRRADDRRPTAAERTASLLAELERERRPGGLAVVGASATLELLARGGVRTLLVADDPPNTDGDGVPGRTAWYGPAPTDAALEPEALRRPGPWPRRERLVDIAVRAALCTGAQVHVMAADTRQETVPDGVAALCGYG